MRRFTPLYGVILVGLVMAVVVAADYALVGGFRHSGFQRVSPGRDGLVRLSVADLEPLEVRFYRFLNPGNQEVKFFVGRDGEGHIQVGFDANEICYKRKRGYEAQGEWLVCQTCEKAFRLAEVNAGGGGCKPVPVDHRLDGDQLILAEADILKGWRFFR